METRECSICGKKVTEGYLFDGTDCFCSKECAVKFFNNDEGCVNILIDEADRLVWHDNFDGTENVDVQDCTIVPFTIKETFDVAKFFMWIIFDKNVSFHPDDSFAEYVNTETGEPTFTDQEAEYYDGVMRDCFNVCEKNGCDIYAISLIVDGLFLYCNGNEEFAKFFFANLMVGCD